MDLVPVRRALLSVSDKSGLKGLAEELCKWGVSLCSTGGTLRFLREHGFAVEAVEEVTGFPEMLDGRVKTLHPKIHGGILARRESAEHLSALEKHAIPLWDLVVVNLYPFEQVSKSGADFATTIENIDIGGPAMIRSAAKNAESVAVLVDPTQYPEFIAELQKHSGATSRTLREKWRLAAFRRTAEYDAAIAQWLSEKQSSPIFYIALEQKQKLRYGENPHQEAGYFAPRDKKPSWQQLSGKELSFNNLLDLDIAIRLACDFHEPVCAIFKHTNPCGVAAGGEPALLAEKAMAADPVSFFGGIVVFNRTLDPAAAEKLSPHFFELIIAPDFAPEALAILQKKKNLRLIQFDPQAHDPQFPDVRSLPAAGGYLIQDQDLPLWHENALRVVSKAQPDFATLRELEFAFRVAKFVKSNAVVFAKDNMTLAIGAGQMSRIDSIHIAQRKAAEAGHSLAGSVLASEAFFPFRDSVDLAAQLGVRAIVQPGGSLRDEESIAAADEHGLVLVFCGMRHFRH
ncbi:MAG: bifunctional phosphoribosylaminoimidazolecarboxamide formyltransferase/IMP cyclohydrolase [Leptospiraceae bacterium]|nr:bifunctional phosphoribosylaminoimidazolecarboxamide formyltransferase/IMP cyclohydrolase [Leptospiraceae bacterium]